MSIQDQKDLLGILKAGKFVAYVRKALKAKAIPGISTWELDQYADKLFKEAGAIPAPKFEYGFPGITCISVNEEAAHGIPRKDKRLKAGDLVNIDVSAKLDNYYADTGESFCIGRNQRLELLCQAAKKATEAGVSQAISGNPLRLIGKAIHAMAKESGFTVIRNLAGHGTGGKLHEAPEVLNFENKRDKRILNQGLVLAVESFISTGATEVWEESDGWTLTTPDGSYVAQFEHTIIVGPDQATIATL
jgi:methionyl aminopeptidase